MAKEKETKQPREFVPSKRLKALHRDFDDGKSLKQRAKEMANSPVETLSALSLQWQLNKGISL